MGSRSTCCWLGAVLVLILVDRDRAKSAPAGKMMTNDADGFYEVGERLEMNCTLTKGRTNRVKISPHKSNKAYCSSKSEYCSSKRGSAHLVIPSLLKTHQGSYDCYTRKGTRLARKKIYVGSLAGNMVINDDDGFYEVGERLEMKCTLTKGWKSGVKICHNKSIKSDCSSGRGSVPLVIPRLKQNHQGDYDCYTRKNTWLARKKIYVGYPPEKPKDINCVSNNFEDMTCEWDSGKSERELNLPTRWELTYRQDSGDSGEPCPSLSKAECHWKLNNADPRSRYNITISVKNRLGSNQSDSALPSAAQLVKPASVKNIAVMVTGSTTIQLHWDIPLPIIFQEDLIYNISYTNMDWPDGTGTMAGDIPNWWNRSVHTNISVHSLHPFSNYKFAVKIKPKIGGFWSDAVDTEKRTLEDVPMAPPRLINASFTEDSVLDSNRTIHLYWKAPDQKFSNGNITRYKIKATSLDSEREANIYVVGSSSQFTIRVDRSYQVDVFAATKIGYSLEYSTVIIPRHSDVLGSVGAVTVELNNTHANIFWERPERSVEQRLTGYTVHYCQAEITRVDKVVAECKGDSYKWIPTDRKQTSLALTMDLKGRIDYRFGVSAETGEFSSGIAWAECNYQHDQVPDKVTGVVTTDKDETELVIDWNQIGCSGIVQGRVIYYQISYWQGTHPDDRPCEDGTKVNFTGRWNMDVARLVHLEPKTEYWICVRGVAPLGPGPWSNRISAITREVVPVLYISVGVLAFIFVVFITATCCWVVRRINKPLEITLPKPVEEQNDYTYANSVRSGDSRDTDTSDNCEEDQPLVGEDDRRLAHGPESNDSETFSDTDERGGRSTMEGLDVGDNNIRARKVTETQSETPLCLTLSPNPRDSGFLEASPTGVKPDYVVDLGENRFFPGGYQDMDKADLANGHSNLGKFENNGIRVFHDNDILWRGSEIMISYPPQSDSASPLTSYCRYGEVQDMTPPSIEFHRQHSVKPLKISDIGNRLREISNIGGVTENADLRVAVVAELSHTNANTNGNNCIPGEGFDRNGERIDDLDFSSGLPSSYVNTSGYLPMVGDIDEQHPTDMSNQSSITPYVKLNSDSPASDLAAVDEMPLAIGNGADNSHLFTCDHNHSNNLTISEYPTIDHSTTGDSHASHNNHPTFDRSSSITSHESVSYHPRADSQVQLNQLEFDSDYTDNSGYIPHTVDAPTVSVAFNAQGRVRTPDLSSIFPGPIVGCDQETQL